MSEQYRIIIAPEAQEDIRSVVRYIAGDLASPSAALALLRDLQNAIRSLATLPNRYQPLDNLPIHDMVVRRITVKRYHLYYVIKEEQAIVSVIAVIYAGRDQAKQLSERVAPY